MAFKSKSKSKGKILDKVITVVKLAGGGYIANQASNFLEKQAFAASMGNYVAAAPLVAGAVGAMYLPENLKPIAFGMVAVAGTELLESVINKATTTTANTTASTSTGTGTETALSGFPTKFQMGFVPQVQPDGKEVITYNGLPLR